jgi:formylglycine-generating enzyme
MRIQSIRFVTGTSMTGLLKKREVFRGTRLLALLRVTDHSTTLASAILQSGLRSTRPHSNGCCDTTSTPTTKPITIPLHAISIFPQLQRPNQLAFRKKCAIGFPGCFLLAEHSLGSARTMVDRTMVDSKEGRMNSGPVNQMLIASCLLLLGSYSHAQELTKQVENTIGMQLTLIPAGEFIMGLEDSQEFLSAFPKEQLEFYVGDLPSHRVRITRPFYLGTHEVTLGQLQEFRRDAKYKFDCEKAGKICWGYSSKGKLIESTVFRPWKTVAWEPLPEYPAVYVSWNDATAFCKWLSDKEKQNYRLPTEAEWEYACRAGTTTMYSCGNRFSVEIGNAGGREYLDGYQRIAPIGKYGANAFGLHDMHGNVEEWCSDWYADDYYKNSPTDDPQGPSDGVKRVARGGSFENQAILLRSAARSDGLASNAFHSRGFRVVRTVE